MRRLVVVLGILAVVLAGAGPALAVDPVEAQGLVTDPTGALGTAAPAVSSSLEQLRDKDGLGVYVVLVDGFDVRGHDDWATATASLSELDDSEMLLAIDVTGHAYEWWLGDGFGTPTRDVQDLVVSRVEPLVATGKWSAAVTALADGLTAESGTFLGGSAVVEPWSGTTTALVGLIVVGTLGGAHLLSRRRPATAATPPRR